jgi:hypothetical protein
VAFRRERRWPGAIVQICLKVLTCHLLFDEDCRSAHLACAPASPLGQRHYLECPEPRNVQNRAIVNSAPSSARRTISIDKKQGHGLKLQRPDYVLDGCRFPLLDPFPGSDIMNTHSDTNPTKSPEPPLTAPGATTDAERAEPPPLLEAPYKPYANLPPPGPPYEPYKNI